MMNGSNRTRTGYNRFYFRWSFFVDKNFAYHFTVCAYEVSVLKIPTFGPFTRISFRNYGTQSPLGWILIDGTLEEGERNF